MGRCVIHAACVYAVHRLPDFCVFAACKVCMVDCREPAKCVAITRLPSSVTFVRFLSGGLVHLSACCGLSFVVSIPVACLHAGLSFVLSIPVACLHAVVCRSFFLSVLPVCMLWSVICFYLCCPRRNSVVLADTKDSMLLYDVRRWAAPMVKIPGYHNSYKRSPVAVDGHWCDTVVVACPHWPAPGVCACTSPISAWEAHTGTQLTTKAVDCEYVSSRITSLGLCRLINGAILAPFVTQSAGRGLFQLPR